MTALECFTTARYIAQIIQIVEDQGLHLEVGHDFRFFSDIPNQQPGRGRVAPIFDPAFTSISSATGFWVVGRDDKDEIVVTLATRLIDLGEVTLEEHFTDYLRDYRPFGDEIDLDGSSVYLTPQTAAITGKLCYYGELWIKPGPTGYRGGCLTAIMPRLGYALSQLEWSPDYTIGLMEQTAALRGLSIREGYSHIEQGTFHWRYHDGRAPLEECLVWMNRADIRNLLRTSPQEIAEQYPSQNPRSSKQGLEVGQAAE